MAQLRQLERVLEASIAEKNLALAEDKLDQFIHDNSPIEWSVSTKLQDMLVRLDANSPVLLEALVRLAPCLIYIEQIKVWFNRLKPFALDSGGRDNTMVKLSREFLGVVLAGDFYADDPELAQTYRNNSLQVLKWLLMIYVGDQSLGDSTPPENTLGRSEAAEEERLRFIRFNCRSLIIGQGARDPEGAFRLVNEYLVMPKHRLDILQLVSEFVATRQTAKLFKVCDTPLFESLIRCLEFDKSAPALTIAATTLAMLLPHVCDRLVPILPRLYACFGRLCSWQPPHENPDAHNNTVNNDWEVLKEEGDSSDGADVESLFTYLYGLFPRNTLVFCRQSDEYLTRMQYTRPFSDFWSRFMVHHRAELVAPHYTVHPLLLSQTAEQERQDSSKRWQSFGSTVQLSLDCQSLRVPDPSGIVQDQESRIDELFVEHQKQFQAAYSRTQNSSLLGSKPESKPIDSPLESPLSMNILGRNSSVSPSVSAQPSPLMAPASLEPKDNYSVAFWRRELLLNKNELDFANFSRYISERRTVRLQKQVNELGIVRIRNEELEKRARKLSQQLVTLEEQADRAQRSARTLLRERNAYESTLVEKNRDLRSKIQALEAQVRHLEEQQHQAVLERKAALDRTCAMEMQVSNLEVELAGLKQLYEVPASIDQDFTGADAIPQQTDGSENPVDKDLAQARLEVEGLKHEIQLLKEQHEREMAEMRQLLNARVPPPQQPLSSSIKVIDPDLGLRKAHEDLVRHYVALQREMEARQVHEEERMNELRVALMSARPFNSGEVLQGSETRFKGRGGAQGIVRR